MSVGKLSSITVFSGVPLDPNYTHTFAADSFASQFTQFQAYPHQVFDHVAWVRPGTVRVAANLIDAEHWNYMRYVNAYVNAAGQTVTHDHYAFITGAEYIAPETTELTYIDDEFQTYLFDIDVGRCLVERQHTVTDNFGENRNPEETPAGEYVTLSYETATFPVADSQRFDCIIFACTFDYSLATQTITNRHYPGAVLNGVWSSLKYVNFAVGNEGGIRAFINAVIEANLIDGIVSVTMSPSVYPTASSAVYQNFQTFDRLRYHAGVNFKNTKTYQSPYHMMHVCSDSGDADFKPELWNDSTAEFICYLTVNPEYTAVLVPFHYNGNTSIYGDMENRMALNGWPQCAIDADVYKVWLAQENASSVLKNFNVQNAPRAEALVRGGLRLAGGAFKGASKSPKILGAKGKAISAAVGAVSEIPEALGDYLDVIHTENELKSKPTEIRGSQTSSADYAIGAKKFIIKYMALTVDVLKQVDDYFSMFGYSIRKIQMPNLRARPHWTYVKTYGSHVLTRSTSDGVPPQATATINAVMDKGCTFWRNLAEIGHYELDNSPANYISINSYLSAPGEEPESEFQEVILGAEEEDTI